MWLLRAVLLLLHPLAVLLHHLLLSRPVAAHSPSEPHGLIC
jgi:hypothetical protein